MDPQQVDTAEREQRQRDLVARLVTAGATVASWKAGSSTAAGDRLAANTPITAPIAPTTRAATRTPMIAYGRKRRSNNA